jgi:nitrogen fixation protein NifX
MGISRRMQILPDPESTALMDTAIKVAFATSDLKTVNQHFGSAQTFAFYAVNPERGELLEVTEFGKLEQDGNEDKLGTKVALLEGCAAVYCQAIGASAVRQLVAKGVQPVKVQEGSAIAELVADLQAELVAGPSSWLAKAIARTKGPDAERFAEAEFQNWDE